MDNLQQRHQEMVYPAVRMLAGNVGGSGTVVYSAQQEDGSFRTLVLGCHLVIDSLVKIEDEWDSKIGRKRKVERRLTAQCQVFQYNDWSRCIGITGIEADIVAYDSKHDMTLLELRDRENGRPYVAQLVGKSRSNDILLGAKLFAVGAALLHPPILTEGMLNFKDDEIEGKKYWMCLPAGEELFLNPMGPTPIEASLVGEKVASFSWAKGVHLAQIAHAHPAGYKAIVTIRTNRRTLRCSTDHPILVRRWTQGRAHSRPKRIFQSTLEWIPAAQVRAKDQVVIATRIPVHGAGRRISATEAELIGFFLGDGCILYRNRRGRQYCDGVDIAASDELTRARIIELLTIVFGKCNPSKLGVRVYGQKAAEFFNTFGRYSHERTLPSWVYFLRPSLKRMILRGYIDSDGCVDRERVIFQATSEQLIRGLRNLCLTLGLDVGNVLNRGITGFGTHTQWRFESRDARWDAVGGIKLSKCVPRARVASGQAWQHRGIDLDPVVSVVPSKLELPVYNVEVDATHTFVASGIVTHNSSAQIIFGNSGGAMYWWDGTRYWLIGIPSRIAISGGLFSMDAITHMGYFSPPERVYEFLDENDYQFVYDAEQTPQECDRRRKEKVEQDRKRIDIVEGLVER